jgi:hypothetical protein
MHRDAFFFLPTPLVSYVYSAFRVALTSLVIRHFSTSLASQLSLACDNIVTGPFPLNRQHRSAGSWPQQLDTPIQPLEAFW